MKKKTKLRNVHKKYINENEDEYESLQINKDNLYEKNTTKNPSKIIIIYLSLILLFITLIVYIIYLKINNSKNNLRRRKYNLNYDNKNKILGKINNFGSNNEPKYQKYNENNNIKEEYKYYDKKNDKKIIIDNKEIIYEPILPENNKEQIVNKYNITKYNTNNIRYHFHDIYSKRDLFKINYSFFPYKKINKSLSYAENANAIFNSTGMLNITKLDFYYYNITKDTSKYNHINLAMGFDKKYIYISLISIISILNTSNINTYIHLHLCINYFSYEDMEKIIQLKKVNENIEFLFYNGKQAELDFLDRARNEYLGIGDYNRVLLPQIVNNTNKILILDSGDILAFKDLSEIYYFDLEDNYFGWILDSEAGNVFNTFDRFFANNFYPNTGVCLVNIRKFRNDNLYEKAFFTAYAYRVINLPYQDIFLKISDFKIKIFPLNYNCKQFYNYKEQIYNRNITNNYIMKWIHGQKFSIFKYSKDKIYEAALDPVIYHLYQDKIQAGDVNKDFTIQWIKYANMTGYYKEIKERYPIPFQKYEGYIK